ncbi:RNA methyltransferase [bacterium]|nr:RNA methyltransferase [bacterium]
MEITSVNNELVKQTAKLQQKKYRNSEKKFLLEGYKAIKEAFDFGINIEHVFVLNSSASKYNFLNEKIILTNEPVLKKISTTETAPEAVAVGCQLDFAPEVLRNSQKVILLENIKDAGNLGTILRSASAFNADAVILYGHDTVDFYNPKCVRASVGNLWKIPVINIENLDTLKKYFDNFSRIATLPRANNYLKTYTPQFPLLVMFGSEADGLSEELIDYSTETLKIEMNESVESLNLGTSCSIIMYKLFV